MINNAMKRLDRLEAGQQNDIVNAISKLMDELSDIASGGDGTLGNELNLAGLLETTDDTRKRPEKAGLSTTREVTLPCSRK